MNSSLATDAIALLNQLTDEVNAYGLRGTHPDAATTLVREMQDALAKAERSILHAARTERQMRFLANRAAQTERHAEALRNNAL